MYVNRRLTEPGGPQGRWAPSQALSTDTATLPTHEQACEGSEGVSQGTAGETGKNEPRGAEVMGVMLLTLNHTHTYMHTHPH